MLTLHPDAVRAVHAATEVSHLHRSVQAAIELEHSTIPPYLTALFSLKQGSNVEAAEIIGSVAGEEMLHMAIACNLMNALGGEPAIDDPSFIPAYPGPLPMGVHASLTVGLEKLTRRQVHDVFMAIEEPEHPMEIPTAEPLESRESPLATTQFATIGDFYTAIKAKLHELHDDGQPVIVGDPARQVADARWYPADQLFAILDLRDAIRAIDVIVDQGEGTSTSPIDASGEVAHFYRFAEIVHGRRLIAVSRPPGWAYAGDPVPLDPAGVWNLLPDAKAYDYPSDSAVRVLADTFNSAYSNLLRCLHRVFNGAPDQLSTALSAMVEMQLTAQKLVATAVPGTSYFGAPTFEYRPD